VQTLTVNASLGNFTLSLDGGSSKSSALTAGFSTTDLENAIISLGISDVKVITDDDGHFYTIIYSAPAGSDIEQLEVFDAV